MKVRSVSGDPTAQRDRYAFLDLFARFLPAGFYYKTFMSRDWRAFEPRIRKMAGLGVVDVTRTAQAVAEQIHHPCDVLVVGGGPAGLTAARAAARDGLKVVLCDERDRFGGSLLYRSAILEETHGRAWVETVVEELTQCGALLLPQTTAFGVYDHLLVGLNQRQPKGGLDRLWRVRPRRMILATGAIERPLPFGNNDLPGILSAEAALNYLRRYGVVVGKKIVVATNNSSPWETAEALAAAGSDVTLVGTRADGPAAPERVRLIRNKSVAKANGHGAIESVELSDATWLEADALIVSAGFSPTVHLFCQAQGKLEWREPILAYAPGAPLKNIAVVGAANGEFSFDRALAEAARAGAEGASPPRTRGGEELAIIASWPKPKREGRVWIDYQNDVTAKDVELAARENFVSVEHLKRYTTLGMATDQGKTSNVNGLALMAEITGRTIPEVGATTYRPPYTPVPFRSLAGASGGVLMNPVRRLPLEARHRAAGATFQEYGGWLRPAFYGSGPLKDAAAREALRAREGVALFDASPLGKIEVIGPDAAKLVDFLYYNTMSTLKPGRCRYGFLLSESGIVYDDGVLVRLDEHRFVVSCSSSHVAGVHAMIEEWRQDRFDRRRVFVHNATAEHATLTVSGPKAKALLGELALGVSLDNSALPHMATAVGAFEGHEVRLTRVSFTGDLSYEISIRADLAAELWDRLTQGGAAYDATLLGLEALMILRAEKGYVVVGKDTDGMSRPMDFGVAAPLQNKTSEFVGRRSLWMEEAQRPDRRQLVGLEVVDELGALPTGAHGVDLASGSPRSLGYVTSSYFSPNLERPIALALIENGRARHGEILDVQHLGLRRKARIAAPCAFDSEGARLHA